MTDLTWDLVVDSFNKRIAKNEDSQYLKDFLDIVQSIMHVLPTPTALEHHEDSSFLYWNICDDTVLSLGKVYSVHADDKTYAYPIGYGVEYTHEIKLELMEILTTSLLSYYNYEPIVEVFTMTAKANRAELDDFLEYIKDEVKAPNEDIYEGVCQAYWTNETRPDVYLSFENGYHINGLANISFLVYNEDTKFLLKEILKTYTDPKQHNDISGEVSQGRNI